jgi:hypothetical protein
VDRKEIFMRLAYLSILVIAAACGDDPVSYSAPVGINLKAKSSDTANGVVSDEKAINTESGNPYGAFVNDAQRKLGRAPGEIDVANVELFLGAASTRVTTLGEVFNGTVEVVFQMNDTNNSYPVATAAITAATASGPVAFDATFAAPDVPALDYEKLLNGSFKVITRGPAATEFSTKGAEADLQVTFTFAAYE